MPFVHVRDISIYHEVHGTGPRLLFIAGTGGDVRAGSAVLDSAMPERFQVLAYDQRGLGQTGKPDVPCTMADYADDAAALLAAVGWDDAMVVGVSFGGMVAQELVLRHPALVQRLVLCCTSSGGAGGSSYPLHDLPDLPPGSLARFRMAIMDRRRDEDWQAAHPDEAAAVLKPMVVAMLAREADPVAAAGFRRQIEARAGHDTYDRLPEINIPTLVCGGLYDGQAEPGNARALAGRIPGAEIEFFEGGHAFLTQDPAAWDRIGIFLAEGALEPAG